MTMADVRIAEDWKEILKDEFSQPYFEELVSFVKSEYSGGVVYPAGKNIFRAFDRCPLDKLKVVIIGQDPYHGPGQANDSASRWVRVFPSHHRFAISCRRCMTTLVRPSPRRESWSAGRSRVYFCLTRCSRCVPMRRRRMRVAAGSVLPMLSLGLLPSVSRALYICFGVAMHKKKEPLLTPIRI